MEKIMVSNLAMQEMLAKFRDRKSNISICNLCVENMSIFLAGEISNHLKRKEEIITTPLGRKKCLLIDESIVFIPILRAGMAMLPGFQKIFSEYEVGVVWAHRDEYGKAHIDNMKLPKNMQGKTAIILDTMLATGGTVSACVDILKNKNVLQIFCASILATQCGIDNISSELDALFFVDSSDTLDEKLYIFPGVGDSGDRLFGNAQYNLLY